LQSVVAGILPLPGFVPPKRIPAPSRPHEIFIGRLLAMWVHPFAAWHLSSRAGRFAVIAGYAAAGYVVTLSALQLFVAGSPF
jgi:hypothetical protein